MHRPHRPTARFAPLVAALCLGGLSATHARCEAPRAYDGEPFNGETVWLAPDAYAPRQPGAQSDPKLADTLFGQARDAAERGSVSEAMRLATRALVADPDHAEARRVLGYERLEEGPAGRWVTPYELRRAERGERWDPRFGWARPEDFPRFEGGERRVGRRWVAPDVDDRLHATIDRGWQVRTDHFLVTTNHSPEAAARLAGALERLFQAWRQLFAGYWLGEREVRERFAGRRNARGSTRPLAVFCHRDQQGYVAALRAKQPRVAETLGIYFDDTRQAHFYATSGAAGPDPVTLHHEATHQLFQELGGAPKGVGDDGGFWLVEGVATYLETLTPVTLPQGAAFRVGAPDAGRLPAARDRLLAEGYHVPLEELASLGRADLQRRPDLARLYGQAAGMTTYLMHADGGRWSEGLVDQLRDLYHRRPAAPGLAERLGVSPAELDAGYRRWMAGLPLPAGATNVGDPAPLD